MISNREICFQLQILAVLYIYNARIRSNASMICAYIQSPLLGSHILVKGDQEATPCANIEFHH